MAKPSMLDGLEDKSPEPRDKSFERKGGKVDEGATRDKTAKTPKTLGPRTA